MVLVTSYTDPDLDGTACAVAYSELLNRQGREAAVGFLGTPHLEARYAMKRFGVEIPDFSASYEEIILLDTSFYRDDLLVDPAKVVEVIDHRKGSVPSDFPNAVFQVELVGAAATLVEERWQAAGLVALPSTARLLQAAILSNTLNFKAAVTTDRDRASFARLAAQAPLPTGLVHDMFEAKSDLSGDRLRESLMGDRLLCEIQGKKSAMFQLEIIGVARLLAERGTEILGIAAESVAQENLSYCLISAIDLEEAATYFMSESEATRRLLSQALSCSFEAGIARFDRPILRKELRPIMQDVRIA